MPATFPCCAHLGLARQGQRKLRPHDVVKVVCPVPHCSHHPETLLQGAGRAPGGACGHFPPPSGLALLPPTSSHASASLVVAMTMVTKPVWDCSWVLIKVCLILLLPHCWKSDGQLRCVPTTLHPCLFFLYCPQINAQRWVKQTRVFAGGVSPVDAVPGCCYGILGAGGKGLCCSRSLPRG